MMATPLRFNQTSSLSVLNTARAATRLLVVDDDALVRELLRAVLQLEGFTVNCAADGKEALSLYGNAQFDMLVTDFQMPGMDGYALACAFTDRRPALPVLLISGASEDELPLRFIAEKRWAFLPKPVDRKLLVSVIDRACFGPSRRESRDDLSGYRHTSSGLPLN